MVDSVRIDSNYDGKVFNITLADVPEQKNDVVKGKCVVEAKKGATVVVKVTDMRGGAGGETGLERMRPWLITNR